MIRQFTTGMSFVMGDGRTREFEVTVSYTVTPARGVTPPSYASGGSPAEDAGIEDIEILTVDGRDCDFEQEQFLDSILEIFERGDYNNQMLDF